MTSSFTLTEGAVEDLKDIWNSISKYNIYAANKVEAEILECCEHLADFHYQEVEKKHYRP